MMLKRFNRWYDDLVEPWRFLFFLVVLMGWIPLLQLDYFDATVWRVIGVAWMLTTCTIAFSRLSRFR